MPVHVVSVVPMEDKLLVQGRAFYEAFPPDDACLPTIVCQRARVFFIQQLSLDLNFVRGFSTKGGRWLAATRVCGQLSVSVDLALYRTKDESVCERERTETHKPPCQAYYRIIVVFAIAMVFANYVDAWFSAGRIGRRRTKGSSRVGSRRGTRYTAIDTSTDWLKLTMTKGVRGTIPTGDSHTDIVA